jgi:hypothetical protein
MRADVPLGFQRADEEAARLIVRRRSASRNLPARHPAQAVPARAVDKPGQPAELAAGPVRFTGPDCWRPTSNRSPPTRDVRAAAERSGNLLARAAIRNVAGPN